MTSRRRRSVQNRVRVLFLLSLRHLLPMGRHERWERLATTNLLRMAVGFSFHEHRQIERPARIWEMDGDVSPPTFVLEQEEASSPRRTSGCEHDPLPPPKSG